MRRMLFGLVVPVLFSAGAPGAVSAQGGAPAGSGPAAPQQQAADRWALAVDLGFNGQVGNTQLVALSTGFELEHLDTERFELELKAGYQYGRSQGETVARSAQTRVTVNALPQARWSPFIFSSAERDRFKRLDLRSTSGGGLQYRFWDSDRGRVSLRAAALYSYENFAPGPDPTLDGTRQNARWNLRFEAESRIGESARIAHSSSWQPVWDRASDHEVELTTSLTTRVSERISMTLNHVYQHDSVPPEGVKRDDQRLVAGLRLDL